ncbi:MAG: 1,2-phenylacetyl-CoA epoxidase subunit PaaC [Acidimicrobiia bacterium]
MTTSQGELTPGEVEFLLAFADDEHLIGQRHTEWIGIAPFLEEDLAFASIAQDELGHAAALYELVDADVDRLALLRSPAEYRSSWFVEHPGDDWADAIVRQWLYDLAEEHRWAAVAGSRLAPLAHLAARAEREEQYHRRHARALLDAMWPDASARARLDAALATMLPLAVQQFEAVAGEGDALASGLSTTPWSDALPQWQDAVEAVIGPRSWPEPGAGATAGRTMRSAHFAAVYDELRAVITIDASATW